MPYKKISLVTMVVMSLILCGTVDYAAANTFISIFNPDDVYLDKNAYPWPTVSYNYSHNILTEGFNTSDTLTSANILFDFNADNTTHGNVDIYFDNTLFTTLNLTSGIHSYSYSVPLANLQSDGILNVKLMRSDNGNPNHFYFMDSTLTAITGDPVPAIPEPATMSLLGLGIAGLIGFRKKNRKP